MSTLLKVKGITKIYPNQQKPGLDHVSFEVMQGEFLGIMGASGSAYTNCSLHGNSIRKLLVSIEKCPE